MNSHPLISIITPCRNSARYIEQCISSIRLQEYRNVEHIIVDGASTDETVSIIKRHEGRYNMQWISEPDKSATEAVNKGIKMVKGDIVAFLASDSFYLPWTAQSVVKAFAEHAHADIVYGDRVQWLFGSKYGRPAFAPSEARLGATIRFAGFATEAEFYDKNVINELGPLDETLTILSDYDYDIRAWKLFRWHKLDEILSCMILSLNSTSLAGGSATMEQKREVRSRHFPVSSYLRELTFTAGYAAFTAKQNLTLLANSLSTNGRADRWNQLIKCESISRARLVGTVLSTWLLESRNRYAARFRIGYIMVDKLSELAFANRGLLPPASPS